MENEGQKGCLKHCKVNQPLLDKLTALFAEFLGTLLLVLLGCLGCVTTEAWPNSFMQIIVNFGLVVMIVLICIAHISGSHINPSVTVAALIYDRISLLMAGLYVVVQCVGAVVGYGLLMTLIPSDAVKPMDAAHGLCVTTLHPDISIIQGFAIEFIITATLAIVCCSVWDPRNARFYDSLSLRFGLTISCLACTGGRFTGGSMNPARSLAPALWHLDFTDHWIYWVAPLSGSAVAAFLCKYVFRRQEPKSDA